MASIHKKRLPSGEVVWELTHGTGRDRRRFVAGKTRSEANVVLKQFEDQLKLHGEAPEGLTVSDSIARYLAFLKANRRPNTLRRYARVLSTFDRCFLKTYHADVERLRDVRPVHIESYKQRRANGEIVEAESDAHRERERGLRERQQQQPHSRFRENAVYGWLGRKRLRRTVAPRTINYELRTVATFFGWAIKNNLLTVNPAGMIERFRVPKRVVPKFMTSEDLKKFFNACSDGDRRLFIAILLSGMRRGEVEYLTWEDISFELGVIFIRGKMDIGWQPKTDERIIPMSPTLHQILVEQRVSSHESRWVFPNREGQHDTHILQKLQKVCRKAGIRQTTVHALRHSFGAHLRMAGVSLADIADLLGHKDLATTQIYAKVLQEHLRAAVSKLTPLVSNGGVAEPKLLNEAHRGSLPGTTEGGTAINLKSTSAIERESES
jgi:integrase/recombinase XerD